jgi:hypothetical protein
MRNTEVRTSATRFRLMTNRPKQAYAAVLRPIEFCLDLPGGRIPKNYLPVLRCGGEKLPVVRKGTCENSLGVALQ